MDVGWIVCACGGAGGDQKVGSAVVVVAVVVPEEEADGCDCCCCWYIAVLRGVDVFRSGPVIRLPAAYLILME